jgi:hypothetical protein
VPAGETNPADYESLLSWPLRERTCRNVFLCFQRRAVGDVIDKGQKVGGSAQATG